ncbi:dihydroorotase [Bdellovibrio bacteriovorus]|uniref:Dihydroorotase n=1 Tax=Bdellovibrio bacteriovorus TaxID=959 RepID=A0A150WV69_BDEBC|nr:dihydroorotase [Bdellovibrio bacteriovorus]KYG70343.1 dihydroorotase [Bdellovibrio bacteriovorus]
MSQRPFDLLIQGGTCLLPHPTSTGLIEQQADIGIIDGRIEKIATSLQGPALKTINATGLHVLPGVIDSQVHFREPGLTHKEDLESGTRAAILGGVTSIFEMPNTNPGTTTAEAFEDKLNRAKDRAHCNYAFFIGGAHDNVNNIAELELLPHCSGVKIFMGSSTGTLLVEDDETLEKILRQGHRRVIFHSEDEMRLRERKHIATEMADPHYHPVWRDVETAVNSTTRLLKLARKTGRKIHVLHVSTGEEMDLLKDQKDIATVEVLPQHLTLYAPDCYDKLGTYAQQNPPIREKRHMDRIWKAVLDGTVDVIGSDHAPHTKEEKDRPYPSSPSGVPGVQTLVPIMLNHVNEGRLSLIRFVEMVTANQARVFGIVNKGYLRQGFDADVTIVDMKKQKTIDNSWIASKCGWTPFHGMQVKGWMTHTIVGGKLVMENDEVILPSQGQPVNFKDTRS